MNQQTLSPKRVQDLVYYMSPGGAVYLYSKIDKIENGLVFYNGKPNKADSPEMLQEITEGLINYEAYKLSIARSDAEAILTEQAESLLEGHFASRLQDIENSLVSTITNTERAIQQAMTFSDDTTVYAKSVKDELTKAATVITTSIDKLDVSGLNTRMTHKIQEIDSVKADIMSKLEPITKETDKLISSLRELVVPNT